jgi:hypothetical protein
VACDLTLDLIDGGNGLRADLDGLATDFVVAP